MSDGQSGAQSPVAFAMAYLHGTRADLAVGDLITVGHVSNYGRRRRANFVYISSTLDAATWGAELAVGEDQPRIYLVEPTGTVEDDPNVTDKRFPGNPTKSYRTREPVRVVAQVTHWIGHDPASLAAMKNRLKELEALGVEHIDE
jgi:rifampin ADP-ribosylating transferase